MTRDSPEQALRRRIQAAVQALPEPDRARLARIEQGLSTERPGADRRRRAAWLLAALLGGVAVAGATAAWWAARPGMERAAQPAAPEAPRGGETGAVPSRDGSAPDDAAEDESGAGTPARNDDPVIYQR